MSECPLYNGSSFSPLPEACILPKIYPQTPEHFEGMGGGETTNEGNSPEVLLPTEKEDLIGYLLYLS